MQMNHTIRHFDKEKMNDIFLRYWELYSRIPYRRKIGQFPLQKVFYPGRVYKYTQTKDDLNIRKLINSTDLSFPENYVYKFDRISQNYHKLLAENSIYNTKMFRQYLSLRSNIDSIYFNTQPEQDLDFSIDSDFNSKLIDELTITYRFVDSWLYMLPKQIQKLEDGKQYYDLKFDNYDIDSEFSLSIEFLPEELYQYYYKRNEEDNTQLYIISKHDNTFHFYRAYEINHTERYKMENILSKQSLGLEDIGEEFTKIGEVKIDNDYVIEYIPEDDGVFKQIFNVSYGSVNRLHDVYEGTVFQFGQYLSFYQTGYQPPYEMFLEPLIIEGTVYGQYQPVGETTISVKEVD